MADRSKLFPTDGTHTLDDLERALDMMTYIVMKHGESYMPMWLRLEHEVEEARTKSAAMDRVRAYAAKRGIEVGKWKPPE